MLHKHCVQISIVTFIALSLALVLSVCSSESIMASSRNDHNNQNAESKDNTGDRADVATTGNQNISCMGSFMSCRNDITNIVCSHVTYCFIGPTTPFMMANPTQQ